MTEQELAEEEAKILAEAEANEANAAEEKKEEVKPDRRPSSVALLLAQRNEARRADAEKTARLEELEKKVAKVDELEELVAKQAIESEEKIEKSEFYSKNPYAKEFETDIDSLKESK